MFDFTLPLVIPTDRIPYGGYEICQRLTSPVAITPDHDLWLYEPAGWRVAASGKETIISMIKTEIEDACLALDIHEIRKDDKGNIILASGTQQPAEFDCAKHVSRWSRDVWDRLLTQFSRDMVALTSNTPWVSWMNTAVKWDWNTETFLREPNKPEHYTTYQVPFTLPQNIDLLDTPKTSAMLRDLIGDDHEDSVEILETFWGAGLLRATPHRALYLRGEPGIGKSTYTSIFAAMLAPNSWASIDLRPNNNFLFSRIPGKCAVILPEAPDGVLPYQSQLRAAISGDAVLVNAKNKQEVEVVSNATWVFASNHDLRIGQGSSATWDRFVLIRANGTQKRDSKVDIKDYWKILMNAEGYEIRIRAMARFALMMRNNRAAWISAQSRSKSEMAEIAQESSPEQQFFAGCVEVTEKHDDRLFLADFAVRYVEWLKANNGDTRNAYTEANVKRFFSEGLRIRIRKENRATWNGKRGCYFVRGYKFADSVENQDLSEAMKFL